MAATAKKLTKMEKLRLTVGANADESMGAGKVRGSKSLHGATISDPKVPPKDPLDDPHFKQWNGVAWHREMVTIPTDRIIPDPDQPRKDFDDEEIEILSRSLVDNGQLQPIRVRWCDTPGQWVIVAGERRWRAATLAGLDSMPCMIDEGAKTPDEWLVDQLVENCCRVDLAPMEQARAFRRLMNAKYCTSAAEVSRLVGTSKSSVTRALALLDLPEQVTDAIESRDMSPSVAYEISKLDSQEEQLALAETALSNGWGRSRVAEEVQRITEPAPPIVAPCNDEAIKTPDRESTTSKAPIVAPCNDEEIRTGRSGYFPSHQAWVERDLVEDAELSSKAIEAARREGIHTFGQLDARIRKGVTKASFNGSGQALWAALNRAKNAPEPLPSKILPDWRERPSMGLGFPSRVMNLLAGSEIETAGDAWGFLATGYLVEELDWSIEDARLLEHELLRLREQEGDLDPCYRPIGKKSSVVPSPGEGRDVPNPKRKFQDGAIRIVEPPPPPCPEVAEWENSPYTDHRRLVLSVVDGVATVILAEDDVADVMVLASLREAVARMERKMGINPRFVPGRSDR